MRSAATLPLTSRHQSMPVQVLVITGSMGSGKTSVMAEASDLLSAAGIDHAAIDFDGLGIGYVVAPDA